MSGLVSGLRESCREVVVTVTTTPQPRRVYARKYVGGVA